jgi:hypothetical protein
MAGGKAMDFLERLLGWAPDDGDGTLALMLVTASAVAVVLIIVFRGHLLGVQHDAKR